MHTIRRNKKLHTRRYSFDGAPTHTSAGRSKDSITKRSTFNMLNYITEKKIKTFGFAGANVAKAYKSPVGWPAHSMDFQSAEKAFNEIKANGSIYVSLLNEKDRNIKNEG